MWRWHLKKYKFTLILSVNQGIESLCASNLIKLTNYSKQNKTTLGSHGRVFKFKYSDTN